MFSFTLIFILHDIPHCGTFISFTAREGEENQHVEEEEFHNVHDHPR